MAIDEYASSRLMSVWVTARTAPTSMVSTAIVPSTGWKSQRDAVERDVEHPQQAAERGHLGAGRHQRGDRRRARPGRRPGVQTWNGTARDLEQQADRDQREAGVEQHLAALVELATASWIPASWTPPAKP